VLLKQPADGRSRLRFSENLTFGCDFSDVAYTSQIFECRDNHIYGAVAARKKRRLRVATVQDASALFREQSFAQPRTLI
jgi:hypothetical protein